MKHPERPPEDVNPHQLLAKATLCGAVLLPQNPLRRMWMFESHPFLLEIVCAAADARALKGIDSEEVRRRIADVSLTEGKPEHDEVAIFKGRRDALSFTLRILQRDTNEYSAVGTHLTQSGIYRLLNEPSAN